MNLNNMVKAERISESVEANVNDLLDKLCEGEPDGVREMAGAMLATRLITSCAWGDCFQLPPLDEC
ncbi:MAG: hypothetical protein IKK57_09605 [Clostridia bacterium]|nr:hypothetical protein [Clostridia bacterium]